MYDVNHKKICSYKYNILMNASANVKCFTQYNAISCSSQLNADFTYAYLLCI